MLPRTGALIDAGNVDAEHIRRQHERPALALDLEHAALRDLAANGLHARDVLPRHQPQVLRIERERRKVDERGPNRFARNRDWLRVRAVLRAAALKLREEAAL